MKSTLRIEFDFTRNEPFLQISIDRSSDDLRDQMLKAFAEKINFSDHTIFGFYDTQFDEKEGKSLYNIAISDTPPEWAINQRIDHMRSWCKQFFKESEKESFNAFFDTLSAKASLLMSNPKCEPSFRNII